MLMLTARDAVDDRITGLDTGADDYVLKPFDFGELFARVRALARRGPVEREPVLRVGDLSLDLATRTVRRGDVEISLSTKELQLLEVFMRRPGQVLSRVDLLEGAWEMGYENRSNILDVYVTLSADGSTHRSDKSIETVQRRLSAAGQLIKRRPLVRRKPLAPGERDPCEAPPSGRLRALAYRHGHPQAPRRGQTEPLPDSRERARVPRANRWNGSPMSSSATPVPRR